jgi:septal ring factor EnvC (AmiA/AmiB activator)
MPPSLTETLLAPLRLGKDAADAAAAVPDLVGQAIAILRSIDGALGTVGRDVRISSRGVTSLETRLPAGIEQLDERLVTLIDGIAAVREETVALRAAVERLRSDANERFDRLSSQLEDIPATREAIDRTREELSTRLDRALTQLHDLAPTRAAAERLVTDVEKVPGI